jgi:hypothetical protein
LDSLALVGSLEESLPFKHKAKYFGFTIDDTDRHKKHDAGNTNWLKALYHSILKVEFHDENGIPEFDWHHYVVGFPVSVDECHLGEEIFCQIGNGYYYTGLGSNIQPAGIAVFSAYLDKHTPKDAAEKWSTAEQWREEGPDWNHQLEHEVTVIMPKYTAEQKEKVLAKKAAKEKKQNNPRRQALIERRRELIEKVNWKVEEFATFRPEYESGIKRMQDQNVHFGKFLAERYPDLLERWQQWFMVWERDRLRRIQKWWGDKE